MNSSNTKLMSYTESKAHYEILDGLRGVAAVMVVCFHLCEAHSGGNHLEQLINHGYLAVDFFFVLSGFVIGYAYDDRWGTKMNLSGFFKRRLVRLQPMVIIGMLIGGLLYYFQSTQLFPAISETPIWKMLIVMLIGCTLLPVPLSLDIRGWWEMHPLNGPGWSLFYEYIGNILYALFIRKFSKTALSILVFIAGCATIHYVLTCPSGDMVGGWALEPTQIRVGFTRLMYPFFGGLLLSRVCTPKHYKHSFLVCSLLVVIILSIPRIGGADNFWMNGLYESFCIIFLFPFIVYLGASGEVTGKLGSKTCKFLGDISYPIYITHYPFIYYYTGWVYDNKLTMQEALPGALLTLFICIAVAYASLKLYDEPVRVWLKNRFLMKKVKP
ncbi:acyltransferase [uncultured Bacteroides sp.]|uniref:acyltransferase family protein n=1 Tax=uncultured Bacteroides sp. TaxID=162156 RepID=UPI002AA7ED15|nr:acyltransferase [uncultured Bacteroides sp.]